MRTWFGLTGWALLLGTVSLMTAPGTAAAEAHLTFAECSDLVRTPAAEGGRREIEKGRHQIAVPEGQGCENSREVVADIFQVGQVGMPAGLVSWREIPGVGDLVTTSDGDQILISEGVRFPRRATDAESTARSIRIGDCLQTGFGRFLVVQGPNIAGNGTFFASTGCSGRGDTGTWVTAATRDEAAVTCMWLVRGSFGAVGAGGEMGANDWFCQALVR